MAGPRGEITAMAKLCQEKGEPPASKDDEDLANEIHPWSPMWTEDQRAIPECAGWTFTGTERKGAFLEGLRLNFPPAWQDGYNSISNLI